MTRRASSTNRNSTANTPRTFVCPSNLFWCRSFSRAFHFFAPFFSLPSPLCALNCTQPTNNDGRNASQNHQEVKPTLQFPSTSPSPRLLQRIDQWPPRSSCIIIIIIFILTKRQISATACRSTQRFSFEEPRESFRLLFEAIKSLTHHPSPINAKEMDRSTGSPMGSSDDDDDNDDDDRPNSSSSSGDDHEVASAETSNARRRRHAESSHLRSSIKVPLPSAFKASDYDDSSDGSRRNGHGHAALPPPTPPRHDNSHHHQSSSNDDSNGNKLSQDAKTHPQHAPVNLMANEQQYTSAFGHQVGKNGNVGVATAAAAAAPPSTSSQSSSSSTSSFPSSADHHHTQAMHAMSHHHQGKQVHSESKMAPAATAGDAHAGLPISSSSPADANHHQHSQTLTSPALLNPTSSQQQQQQLPYHHHDYSSSSMSRSATLDLVSPYLMAAGAMLAQNTNFQTAQVDSLNTTPTTANATHNTRKPRTWYDVLNERDTPM
mmetsp:Transcript_13845/g.39428  ORF Transcript_13845/g.39428 Transcript_13845/m.39428 type:complete len:490 (-) Transcript_13845:947-2416(-)